jgi:hypothetical protein
MADDNEDENIIRLNKLKNNPLFGEQQRKSEEIPNITSTKDVTEQLNEKHAQIILTGRYKILHEKIDGTIEFMDKKDFINKFEHRTLLITGEDNKPKSTPMTEIWLKSQNKRRYDNGIIFDPSRNGHYNGMYNLWKGYKVVGREGDVSPFIDLIRDIICNGNEENFNYLVALISQMFQEPWLKPGIAVVIRGDEGVGKSFFIEKLGSLMGEYYFKTSNPNYIFGDHNGQLKNTILLHLEEAVWAGSKKDESLLKDLITGQTIQINDKFVPVYSVPNHLHLFISGNPEWLVSAGFKARRIFALHASEAHIRDTSYFSKLDEWFKSGGAGALIHYFLNYKYDIDLRIAPITEELIEQKQQSMSGVSEWLYSIADSKEMPFGYKEDNGHVLVIKAILHSDYNSSPSGKRHQLSERKFGRQLVELLPGLVNDNIKLSDNHDVRRNGYDVPTCDDVRKSLEAKIGGKVKWSTPDGEWKVLRANSDFDFTRYKPGS